jgi:2-iminoacetate synthase
MFSQEHQQLWRSLPAGHPSEAEAYDLAGHAPSGAPRLAEVLWAEEFGSGGRLDSVIIDRARQTKSALFGDQAFAVVPMYVTSVCNENCLYCNYRSGNKGVEVERLRLTDDELAQEARHLIEQKGMHVLELVYASDPRVRADSMCRHVEIAQRMLDERGGGIVGISAEALDEDEYRALADAGVSFSVLWQETYDRDRYRELHPGATKKTSFEYRLDAFERMITAGIKNVGIGILSGLADWRMDWAMLMLHEDYLRRQYGQAANILGTPRLTPAPGSILPPGGLIPSTEEFLATVALHNIYAPETLPFVSTREKWDVCVALAKGGGCMFTFNCSTIPGGYSLGRHGAQFRSGSYDAPVFRGRLADEAGVSPQFAWTFDALRPSVGHPA